MEYVREITDSSKLMPLFNLPKAMHNKRVEVIILPIPTYDNVWQPAESIRGRLSMYAKPELQALEGEAWINEVKQRHEAR